MKNSTSIGFKRNSINLGFESKINNHEIAVIQFLHYLRGEFLVIIA